MGIPSAAACGLLILASSLPGQSPGGADIDRRASKALAAARTAAERGRHQDAYGHLRLLRGDLSGSPAAEAAREEIEALWRVSAPEAIGGAAGLLGDAERRPDGTLRIVYDFTSRPGSFADFEDVPTMPDIRSTRLQSGVVSGTGAWCLRACFTGDVAIAVEGLPLTGDDFGLTLVDPDAESPRFVAGVFNNTFFGIKYDEGRSITRAHILILCGKGAESRARTNPSQILGESREPAIKRQEDVSIGLALSRQSLALSANSREFKASLSGPAQSFPRFRAGLHLHRSSFQPRRIEITGRLDPKWSAGEVARLREEAPR